MEKEQLILVVQQAQAGNPEAIGQLFDQYKNTVYSIALRETKSRTLAEDVVQETFVEMIQTIGKVKHPDSFLAWLKQLAYHQCTRYYKRKEIKHEVSAEGNEDSLSILDNLEERNASFLPDEALDQKEFRATILSLIDTLPEVQGTALRMFYFEELSLKAIAQVQGVSINTANTRLNRGRKAIKDAIETYEKKHNIRLHTVFFFPFFKWLLEDTLQQIPAAAAAKAAEGIACQTGVAITISGAAATAGTASGTAAATGAAGLGAKILAVPVSLKVTAAIAAVSIAMGGAAIIHNERKESISAPSESYSASLVSTVSPDPLTKEPTTPSSDFGAYNLVFAQYIHAQQSEFQDCGKYVNDILSVPGVGDKKTVLYYSLLDLNGDETEELLIGYSLSSHDEQIEPCDLYTLDGMRPTRIVDPNSLGHRAHLYILPDGRYAVFGSSGADTSSTSFYSLPPRSACPELLEAYGTDMGMPYYETLDEGWHFITEEEYQELPSIFDIPKQEIQWTIFPASIVTDTPPLLGVLDYTSAWCISSEYEGYPYFVLVAFHEDGSCYSIAGDGWDSAMWGHIGTYDVTGDVITFTWNSIDGTDVMSYKLDAENMLLTQCSEVGFFALPRLQLSFFDHAHIGDTFLIQEDTEYFGDAWELAEHAMEHDAIARSMTNEEINEMYDSAGY